MKVNGSEKLWMVVNPELGSVVYVVAGSETRAWVSAGKMLGVPPLRRQDIEAMGYKAVRITELRFEGEGEETPAYKEGRQAALDGKSKRACPYAGTKAEVVRRVDWLMGYADQAAKEGR